jgi:hypothetical protein
MIARDPALEPPMIRLPVLALFALLLATPFSASAATHKCTVNGQTVYQQTPCADAQGEELKLKPNTVGGGGGGSYSAGEVKKMQQELEGKGRHMVREAYGHLASGNVDVYVANLCPRERQQWSNPTLKVSLRAMGKVLASDRLTLGRQTDVTMDSLSFLALPEPGPVAHDSTVKPRTRTVRAFFGREMGQLCLRALDIGA